MKKIQSEAYNVKEYEENDNLMRIKNVIEKRY